MDDYELWFGIYGRGSGRCLFQGPTSTFVWKYPEKPPRPQSIQLLSRVRVEVNTSDYMSDALPPNHPYGGGMCEFPQLFMFWERLRYRWPSIIIIEKYRSLHGPDGHVTAVMETKNAYRIFEIMWTVRRRRAQLLRAAANSDETNV
jgi:hypothetical protein